MFGKTNENNAAPQAPPAMRFPELRGYEVMNSNGVWEKVEAHHCTLDNGCLQLFRGIFINEECSQVGAEPAAIYAPGEWRRCKTNYRGYMPPSELAI